MKRTKDLFFLKAVCCFLIMFLLGFGHTAGAKNLLFIGNSFTHEGPIANLVSDLAVDAG